MRMDSRELEQLKARVARGFTESPSGDLEGFIEDTRHAIERSELFTAVTVHKTGGLAHQIEVRSRPAKFDIAAQRITRELERIWEEVLRYNDFAAHAVTTSDSAIVLDFLTVARAPRLYLTGMIVIDISEPDRVAKPAPG